MVIRLGRCRFHLGKLVLVTSGVLLLWLLLSTDSNAESNKPPANSPVAVQDQIQPAPFWRAKPAVYESMVSERRIVVSAKTDSVAKETGGEEYEMKVVAAGLVNGPIQDCWTIIQDFEKLPQVDDRFHEVKYDSAKKRLFVHAVAYGYHARMHMQLQTGESPLAREIHFEVVEGNFTGMKGLIRLEDDRRHKTEISMTSNYRSATIPLPSVLMGFGLEVVGSRVAASMREFIETEVKRRQKPVVGE